MNLVQQFHSIHSYTTERMMKTLILLCKKMMKKLQMIDTWSQSAGGLNEGGGPLQRLHSNSFDSLIDLTEVMNPNMNNNTAGTGNSNNSSTGVGRERLIDIQSLYSELSMYKLVTTQLLQFSTILLRSVEYLPSYSIDFMTSLMNID